MFLDEKNTGLNRFIEWTLYIYTALFPFIAYRGYLFYDSSARFINLVFTVEILAFVLGCALLAGKKRLSVAKSPITFTLGLFLLALIVSGMYGIDPSASYWSKATRTTGIFYFIHLGVFYLFVFSLFKNKEKWLTLVKTFLVSSALFSVGALLSRDGFNVMFKAQEWQGFTFGNSTFAAMYLYAAFMLSIYYVLSLPEKARSWWKYMIPLVFVLNPYFINPDFLLGKINPFQYPLDVIGGARATAYTTLFSVVGLCGVWLVSKIKEVRVRRGFLWASVVLGLIVSSVAVSSFFSANGYLHKMYLSGSSTARPIVWELSRKAIHEKPMLGWGSDNFNRVFEKYYDNTLLEQKNGGEGWFDRAHNIFIDQSVDTGYVGLSIYILVYLVIIGCMVFVLRKSKNKDNHYLAVIVLVYFVGHMMELQTAFDTTISYLPLVIMAASGALLFHRAYNEVYPDRKNEWHVSSAFNYVYGTVFVVGSFYLLFSGALPLRKVESTNGIIRSIGTSEKRIALYPVIFNSKMDPGAFLLRAAYDLRRGISQDVSIIEDEKRREGFVKELDVYTQSYVTYLKNNPEDYRAHLNFANVLIYQRLFDVDRLDQAHEVLNDAIKLVPQTPQAYWMQSVTYLYQRKFDLAREWAKKAYDLNPGIEESTRLMEYIERSIKTFPVIDLYVFKQT